MDTLESFLRTEIEPLQYAAFFGALVFFGLLETVVARRREVGVRQRRWLANYGLTLLNIMVLGAVPVSGLVAADFARDQGIGLLNLLVLSPVVAFAAGLLLRSLVSWGLHLAMHKIPLLWRVHRVHHSDRFIDISTTVRFHPAEFLINTPVLLAAIILLGISPVTLLVYELFDAAMAVFTHANIRMPRPLERIFRFFLVTPEMHRVHHSSRYPETDSNYGATFAFWDHLFGTYRDKKESELATMEIGLAEYQDERPDSLWWMLRLPFGPLRIPRAGSVTARRGKGGT